MTLTMTSRSSANNTRHTDALVSASLRQGHRCALR
jgi:hypothetical protein